MEVFKDRKAILFKRYYQKTATKQEIKELFLLLEVTSDSELAELIAKSWSGNHDYSQLLTDDENEKILTGILNKSPVSVQSNRPYVSYYSNKVLAFAALFLIIFSLGLYFYNKVQSPVSINQTAGNKRPIELVPATKKAILTLANGQKIVLDDSENGIVTNEGGVTITKNKDGLLTYTVAAGGGGKGEINTLSTPLGGYFEVILADGTQVWLNAASSIKFPAKFTEKERRVRIEGEAYFEVTKNPDKPFIVDFLDSEIKVLGTHFNVKAYDNEKYSFTTLIEGSINIKNSVISKNIKPAQQVILDNNNAMKLLSNVDIEPVTAWKNNYFQFYNDGIDEVMRQVERWYNVEVVYEKNIPLHAINGRISRNVNLPELLEMLRFTGINFQISGRTIKITD